MKFFTIILLGCSIASFSSESKTCYYSAIASGLNDHDIKSYAAITQGRYEINENTYNSSSCLNHKTAIDLALREQLKAADDLPVASSVYLVSGWIIFITEDQAEDDSRYLKLKAYKNNDYKVYHLWSHYIPEKRKK